jgi:hypothetical protein
MPNLLKKITQRKKENKGFESGSSSSQEELFISIVLSDQELQSALVSRQQEIKEYSSIKTYFDRQDLLVQLDQSLQDLGLLADDVADCVFIFDQSWLKDGELLDSKKVIVQELSEGLSLSALGQMSVIEGLHKSRIMNDPRDSSLTIYLRERDFDLVLIKHGQLLVNLKIGRSANLTDDLQEGLARISQELGEQGKYFPNKLFLTSLNLSQKSLKKEQAQLQAFDWTKVSGFLQEPQFVILETDFLIKSLSLAASHMLSNDFRSKLDQDPIQTQNVEKNIEPEKDSLNEEQLKTEEQKISSFGIDLASDRIKPGKENKESRPSSFESRELKEFNSDQANNPIATDPILVKKPEKSKKMTPLTRFLKKNRKSLIIGVTSGLLALVFFLLIFSLFLSNVTIKIWADEKMLQKNIDIILDPQLAESDFSKNLLKVSLVKKEISGQDTLSTTGISLVGDKAKGKINLFNKTSAEKTFAAGTSLEYEDILFELEEEVTVPAAEEKEGGSGMDYGSAEASVVAKDIGADANIDQNSKLKVGDFSEDTYSATALDNFSGGSSREVRVVSKEDLDTLLIQLRKSLNEIAIDEFANESKDGVYLIPSNINRITSFEYDHEEGDEVETLSLEMSLEAEAVKYLSSDLKQLAQAVLLLDLPENYNFVDEEPSLLSDQPVPDEEDNSRLILSTELSAKSRANINEESLLNLIVGKTIEEAKNDLEGKETITKAEIVYQPAFLANFVKKLPKNASRFNFIID